MLQRSPLLAFLTGGLLLSLGAILVLSVEPQAPSALARWEDLQRHEDEEEEDPLWLLLTGSVLIALGLGLTVPQVLQWASQTSFAEAVLEPPEEGAPLGGKALVRVRLVPRGTLRVASAQLHLVSEEVAHYVEDTRPHDDEPQLRKRVMEVHRWSTQLPVPPELGGPLELEVAVPLPAELPSTFHWERHAARTRLELEVALIGRMDLHLERELLVLPRYASSGAGA